MAPRGRDHRIKYSKSLSVFLTCVVELSAVVGSGEEGDQLPLSKELIAVLHHLQTTPVTTFPTVLRILPDELYISSQSRVCVKTWPPPRSRRWSWPLCRSPPSPSCPCLGLTTAGRRAGPGLARPSASWSVWERNGQSIKWDRTAKYGRLDMTNLSTFWKREETITDNHLICSILWRSGLSPPWQQKIFSSTMAATGRQLKQSVKVFHSLMLYRLLPTKHCI